MVEFRNIEIVRVAKSNWPKQYFYAERLLQMVCSRFAFSFSLNRIPFNWLFLSFCTYSLRSLSFSLTFFYFDICILFYWFLVFDALNVTIIFRLSDVDTFFVDRFLQVFHASNTCFNFDNENFIATILQCMVKETRRAVHTEKEKESETSISWRSNEHGLR